MAAGTKRIPQIAATRFDSTQEALSLKKKPRFFAPASLSTTTTALLYLDFNVLALRAFRLGEPYLQETLLEGSRYVLGINADRHTIRMPALLEPSRLTFLSTH